MAASEERTESELQAADHDDAPAARVRGGETVKVAAVQAFSDMGTVRENVERLEGFVREAAREGAKIIVLPETSVTGYLSPDLQTNWQLEGRPSEFDATRDLAAADVAEFYNGPSVRHFGELAAELGVYITVPFIEKDVEKPSRIFYNAVSLVGPESGGGRGALAHYRKNCPWPHPEQSWATPGHGVDGAIFETPYGRVGMAICFDVHSVLKKYAKRDIWALLYPIAWVGSTRTWFRDELPGRLQSVNVPFFVLGANWAATDEMLTGPNPPNWSGLGGSSIFGPQGTILAAADDTRRQQIIYANIPVASALPQPRPEFRFKRYYAWTRGQPGTNFWRVNKFA